MNYIAHLHLAQISGTSLVGNFLGDFVKGNQLSHLSNQVERGIRLHRKIDGFTDQHYTVVELRRVFPPNLRRVSGIILDVYFDYLLLQHWPLYSAEPYNQLFSQFYRELAAYQAPHNEHFSRVRQGLIEHNWLLDYRDKRACLRALKTIEHRLNNRIIFAEEAMVYVQRQHHVLEQAFLQFYPELLQQTQRIASKL